VQQAIKSAVNQRYDFIHYIYTTFERNTRTAEPLWRPMWYEFPNDKSYFGIHTQFMVGSSVLFVPKSKTASESYEAAGV
jgi:alpha-glucosidase (family GH31 glycosyl hydrolase)